MDYRELLRKYIAHVLEIQGVDFITMGRTKSSVVLTDDERAALYRISEDAEVASVLGAELPDDHPTLETFASPNLTALFRVVGSYIRQTGPVNLEFRDSDRRLATEQDAFLRHLAEQVVVVSETVVTNEVAAALNPEPTTYVNDPAAGQHVGNHVRAVLTQLARGDAP